jgi:hypothetical protein
MIPANELRKGNWVLFSPSGKAAKVKIRPVFILELLEKSCIVQDSGLKLELFYESASIQPMPITGKLLVKIGFKYGSTEGITSFEDEGFDPDGTTHYWDIEIKRTDLIEHHNISLVKWGEQEYFTFQLERGLYRQKIKHVHQLQNLYSVLSSEELTINVQEDKRSVASKVDSSKQVDKQK